MRFLVDANLSPRLASLLASEGHDALAIREIGLSGASENEIVDFASNDDRIVVSHDTDFGALLAFRGLTRPKFILFWSSDAITPDEQAALIISNLGSFADELEGGAIVVSPEGAFAYADFPFTRGDPTSSDVRRSVSWTNHALATAGLALMGETTHSGAE